ncbi:DUF124 domain-containing protein [hydrothermal vent metagenome]|uniref:DUF124 domain-containing protein n=1 Tax=hydrothermal vent metagenome TaxID=652676 RepID=A0A1W1EIB0_9ZZZZ
MRKEWYIEYDDGRKQGPITKIEAKLAVKNDSSGYAWSEGMSDWQPMNTIEELVGVGNAVPYNPTPPSTPQPPINNRNQQASYSLMSSDEIDYEIFGEDIQYVEIELDPNESAVAEAGSMMYKHSAIVMDTVFGDGSGSRDDSGGLFDRLVGAGKRLVTGESLFTTVFTHKGNGKARVAFAAPYPGRIIPINLKDVGGTIICQKDCFLCAAKGVSIGIYFQKKILTALFGGEGFIMQKLEGDGQAFIHAGGMLKEIQLQAGEHIHLDTGCLVAMEPTVNMDIEQAGGIKTGFFGGEGFFFAKLQGPGKIWIQSLPFSRLASRMYSAAPQAGGHDVGEGSALGIIGDLAMGSRNF